MWIGAAVGVLALLAYVPALASSPGRMPADTKLYLYLDPGRLISDARWTFDGRQFAGWVPHQVISYLWPQGPWYWLGETFGLPDWVTHRLWIGTLMVLAGAGVLWAARRLGLGLGAAFAAAVVYQLSPYVLPYMSRTSAMLLPWAALGWIVGLTVGAATRTRWRDAALAALVVFTVGAVNATALVMIAPAPVLWLLVAAAERQITWGRAGVTAARIGGLSLAVSLWWLVMLLIQGRLGADVLAYSESLESVSFTSTSAEVWRGLGYWLTYVRDAYAATTTAARDYMVSGRLIATGFVLLLIALAGLVATRWPQRRYAAVLVATGVVLGVGVHRFDDPSPIMNVLMGDGESGLALALRSSTRAVPVLVLGLALGVGALVDALGGVRPATAGVIRLAGAAAVTLLAVANLPSLTGHRWVDPALDRDQSPPAAWSDAAAALDSAPAGYRVWRAPGAEFGAFRWGYTVDPPLPGMTSRPLVTRDLLPLGSAPAMDLAYAIDDRFQAGTVEPGSIAPLARLLGADTIWAAGDAAFDRFRTPRPELVHDLYAAEPDGLGPPTPFGAAAPNQPEIPMVDEQSVSDPRVGSPVPPVELVPVEDPTPVVRAKDEVVLVVGSGDGVVDAAAAGLIDGHELIRYTGSLTDDELAAAVADATHVMVTDSNRDRAHHWRSSQDVSGYTEADGTAGPEVLRADRADERLPVFGADASGGYTVAEQGGPVRAVASAYGEPFAYRPEDRAFMAIDGDPETAWRVADRAPAEGEFIRLEVADPIDHVTLRQPVGADAVRHLGQVTITVDDRPGLPVTLDERSFSAAGQRVDLEPTPGPSVVTITIDSVVVPDPTIGPALAAVGFAEIDVGLEPGVEVVRPPRDLVAGELDADAASLTYVFTRLRTRPSDRWRADPEPVMVREIELSGARDFTADVTVRLDQRAGDELLAELLGIDGAQASARLTGVTAAAGWAATDDDPATAWITPFGRAVGSSLALDLAGGEGEIRLAQPEGDFSPITELRLTTPAGRVDLAFPAAGADGTSVVSLSAPLPAGPATLTITAVEPRVTLDRRYAEPVQLPAAIAEVSVGTRTLVPDYVDTGCRGDLLRIDDQPAPVRVVAEVEALLAGEPVEAMLCEQDAITLDAGVHRLTASEGLSGLQLDRVVLASGVNAARGGDGPTATVTSADRLSRRIVVDNCPDGCWLVLGEGFHTSWSATTTAGGLGDPQLVDGGFNGWWIAPADGPTEVTVQWTAQRPLDVALLLTAVAVLACLALALVDRRRAEASAPPVATLEFPGAREPRPVLVGAGVAWVVAAVLLVGPAWGLLAAAGGLALVLVGRPRLVGVVTAGVVVTIGVVMVWVVHDERPWPDAGWPARFEWLHRWGLFAAVSLLVTLAAGDERGALPDRTEPRRREPSADPRQPVEEVERTDQ